jgi:colicin import membrane protein
VDEGLRRDKAMAAPPPAMPASAAPHPVRARTPEQAEQARREAEAQAANEAAQRRDKARERQLRRDQRIAEHEAREKSRLKPPAAPLPLPPASDVGR